MNTISLDMFQGFKILFNSESFENQRFGQAFCNKFDITDSVLFNESCPRRAEKIVLEKYVDWG
jgi:hypothetical protein